MSAPVKLPRRLPDREPVRSGEARDIARAIRCIEHRGWTVVRYPNAAFASACVSRARFRVDVDGRDRDWAGWLPEHLRRVLLAELRRRLDALDGEEQPP